MKNLIFNLLSSVSNFLNEKRFIYLDAPKPQPATPETGKKDVAKMATDTNETIRMAKEAAAAKAKQAANLPGLDEAVARLTGKNNKSKEVAKLDPNTIREAALGKSGENKPAEDVSMAAHDKFPTQSAMPTIEKKKW